MIVFNHKQVIIDSTLSTGLRSLRWLTVKQRLMVNDAVVMHKRLRLSARDKFSTRAFIHDRRDIEIVSIFHLVESMLANAPFIIAA